MKKKLLRMAELVEQHGNLCYYCIFNYDCDSIIRGCDKIVFCSEWEETND